MRVIFFFGILCVCLYTCFGDKNERLRPKFIAYDCSSPEDIAYHSVKETCDISKGAKTNSVEYEVLLEVENKKFTSYKCSMEESKITLHCGMFSHEAFENVPEISVKVGVTEYQCTEWIKGYIKYDGGVTPVNFNGDTFIRDTPIGSHVRNGKTISCVGQEYKVDGKLSSQVVVLRQRKIRISIQNMRVNVNREMVDLSSKTNLKHCRFKSGTCRAGLEVYVWDKFQLPEFDCYLRKIRNAVFNRTFFNGEIHLLDKENKIHVVKKQATKYICGTKVFLTEYDNVYLKNTKGKKIPEIQNYQIDNILWIAARDDYIFNILGRAINSIKLHLGESNVCHWLEENGNKVSNIQDNLFFKKVGEALLTFRCKKKIVFAKEQPCYDKLPLDMEDGKEAFLDPTSRIISKHAVKKRSCDIWSPVYEDVMGTLRKQTSDGISIVHTSNNDLKSLMGKVDIIDSVDESFESGGIFSVKQVEDGMKENDRQSFTDNLPGFMVNMFCSDEDVCNNLVYDENPEQLETGHFGFGFGDISKAIYPNWGSWSGILLTMVKYSTLLVASKYIWDVISKFYRWCFYMRMFKRLYGQYCPWKAGMESSMLEEAYSRTMEMVKEMPLKPNGGDLETGFIDRSVVPASNDA